MKVAENRLTVRRAELLALETRVASVRKLMERRSHDLRRRNEHQEQRRSDDAAQNAARREGPLSAAWSASAEALPLNHH
jgi:flagellar FliJ protein